jgi:hypothetical protein
MHEKGKPDPNGPKTVNAPPAHIGKSWRGPMEETIRPLTGRYTMAALVQITMGGQTRLFSLARGKEEKISDGHGNSIIISPIAMDERGVILRWGKEPQGSSQMLAPRVDLPAEASVSYGGITLEFISMVAGHFDSNNFVAKQ